MITLAGIYLVGSVITWFLARGFWRAAGPPHTQDAFNMWTMAALWPAALVFMAIFWRRINAD